MKWVRKSAALGAVTAAGLVAAATAATAAVPFGAGEVPAANPAVGVQDNVLAAGLRETAVAWGALPLTHPDGSAGVTDYGYNTAAGGPLTQDPHEAPKTEPDKNVYLMFGRHHYLYQGHEGGPRGYVTRIDLDQDDPAQRVTLVADSDPSGVALPTFDGITWDPFSHQLLLTAESAAPTGGVFGVTLDRNGDPTTGRIVRLPLGSGSYEGIQNDRAGNVWIVEDSGGAPAGSVVDGAPRGKLPNSYVYRFRPVDRTDLSKGGTLEALQVRRRDGSPVTAAQLQKDGRAPFISALHRYGSSFATGWVEVADTSNANAAAAAAGATPFKRPENGVFRPGTGFGEFYFTETGDTDARSDLPGAFGAVFRLRQGGPDSRTGSISPVAVGDEEHTGFDNISFATKNRLLFVEDAGETLHEQRNALDSGWDIDVSSASHRMTRWLAEGRDASATYDAYFNPGYNDADNEITGIHTSNGDPSASGILGAAIPTPFRHGWRIFWTQQHGDNMTWELHPDLSD